MHIFHLHAMLQCGGYGFQLQSCSTGSSTYRTLRTPGRMDWLATGGQASDSGRLLSRRAQYALAPDRDFTLRIKYIVNHFNRISR